MAYEGHPNNIVILLASIFFICDCSSHASLSKNVLFSSTSHSPSTSCPPSFHPVTGHTNLNRLHIYNYINNTCLFALVKGGLLPVKAALNAHIHSQHHDCLAAWKWVILKTPLRMAKMQTQVLESLISPRKQICTGRCVGVR